MKPGDIYVDSHHEYIVVRRDGFESLQEERDRLAAELAFKVKQFDEHAAHASGLLVEYEQVQVENQIDKEHIALLELALKTLRAELAQKDVEIERAYANAEGNDCAFRKEMEDNAKLRAELERKDAEIDFVKEERNEYAKLLNLHIIEIGNLRQIAREALECYEQEWDGVPTVYVKALRQIEGGE